MPRASRAGPTVDQVLHNIRDHVITALDILRDGKARGEARARLLAHMAREEASNQAFLTAALEGADPEQRRVVEIALDHSAIIVDILRGDDLDEGFSISLLSHFLEEHEEGFLATSAPSEPAATRPGWTVGSLIEQRRMER